jgi:hypothetical protein
MPRHWTLAAQLDRFMAMRTVHTIPAVVLALLLALLQGSPAAGQSASSEKLFLTGDTVLFLGVGIPHSCALNSYFKPGDRIGFRFTAINPATGTRDRASQLVVHLNYRGQTIDLPMRDRQNVKQPERAFWIAEWKVPDDAMTGIINYSVTARDPQGRTGEFKPFDVAPSQITIVEPRAWEKR